MGDVEAGKRRDVFPQRFRGAIKELKLNYHYMGVYSNSRVPDSNNLN